MVTRLLKIGAYCMLAAGLLVACGGDDDPEEQVEETLPDYLDYYGKWTITDVSTSGKKSLSVEQGKIKADEYLTVKTDKPNLAFYTPSGWSGPVVINENPAIGDYLIVNWCLKNNGTANIELETNTIQIYLDNQLLGSVERSFFYLEPGYYMSDFCGAELWDPHLPQLTEGSHTLRIVLDANGVYDELYENDNEYSLNFIVNPLEIQYKTFEFSKARYWITDDNNLYYGNATSSSNSIDLSGFQDIDNIVVNGSTITFELSGTKSGTIYNTGTLTKRMTGSDLVRRLTDGPWRLDASTHPNPATGQNWIFSAGGSYTFENTSGTTEKMAWDYIDENSFSYTTNGGSGVANISTISNTYLKVTDENYTYEFSR